MIPCSLLNSLNRLSYCDRNNTVVINKGRWGEIVRQEGLFRMYLPRMAVCSQAEHKSGNNMMLTETKTIRRSFLFEDLENKVINSQCSLLKI